ncbi:MAG: HyaD/HybD family hydrogenase maturation endopeptidase [Gammaproteobacteria bacterium]|jgi:hydrogenase maturation protease
MKTIILGIGNSLLRDEGIGIHVLNALKARLPEDDALSLIDGGTLSFTLATEIETSDRLVVIDAAQLGEVPGTVRCFIGDEMDNFLGSCKRSVHEVGLLDLFDIARLTQTLPGQRALVGIQPASVDWGEEPTDQVAAAIPAAVQKVCELLELWQTEVAA